MKFHSKHTSLSILCIKGLKITQGGGRENVTIVGVVNASGKVLDLPNKHKMYTYIYRLYLLDIEKKVAGN